MSDDKRRPNRLLHIVDETASERLEYRPEGLDAVIYYRRLSREAVQEINRRYERIDHRRGRQVYIPEDKRTEVNKDLWDYIILAWEGVADIHGTPVLCTRDNKYKLPGKTMVELLELADTDSAESGGAGSPNS